MTVLHSDKHEISSKQSNNLSNAMLATNAASERYLNPDYLSPLAPLESEKSGKSPLQLLAQTCSQIGADTGTSKSERKSTSPLLVVSDKSESKTSDFSFKPYEISSKRVSPKTKSPSSPPKMGNNAVNSTAKSSLNNLRSNNVASLESLMRPKELNLQSSLQTSHHALEALMNPAFRSGLSSTGLSVCLDPFCRDALCPTAIYHAHLAANYYAEALNNSKVNKEAFVCNWMNAREGRCGRAHSNADELLNHLRTHTEISAPAPRMNLHRFHPYAKNLPPANLAPTNLNLAPNLAPMLYSPSAAASLYALYSARMNGNLQ